MQASLGDGVAFDPFALHDDGLAAAEVDIGRRQVLDALVVTLMIVVVDEGADLTFERTRQIVVLEQDGVLQGLMPALDLALGLRMIWRTADMLHVPLRQPVRQVG